MFLFKKREHRKNNQSYLEFIYLVRSIQNSKIEQSRRKLLAIFSIFMEIRILKYKKKMGLKVIPADVQE